MQGKQVEFREYEYKILAAGAALYFSDDDAQVDADALWKDILPQQMLVAGDGVFSVRAELDCYVKVLVAVRETELELAEAEFTLLGGCLLDVPSGRIVIAGSAELFPDAARIPVSPALYRVAVYAGSLDTIYGGLRKSQNCLRVVLSLG